MSAINTRKRGSRASVTLNFEALKQNLLTKIEQEKNNLENEDADNPDGDNSLEQNKSASREKTGKAGEEDENIR
jgi:hypothetical protein